MLGVVTAAIAATAGLPTRRRSRGRGGRKRARGALGAAWCDFQARPEDSLLEGGLEVILLLNSGRYLIG